MMLHGNVPAEASGVTLPLCESKPPPKYKFHKKRRLLCSVLTLEPQTCKIIQYIVNGFLGEYIKTL